MGTRVVGENERLKTLRDLYDAEKELRFALERFPIVLYDVRRSHKTVQEKENLEARHTKVLEAIKKFESPLVYVKL